MLLFFNEAHTQRTLHDSYIDWNLWFHMIFLYKSEFFFMILLHFYYCNANRDKMIFNLKSRERKLNKIKQQQTLNGHFFILFGLHCPHFIYCGFCSFNRRSYARFLMTIIASYFLFIFFFLLFHWLYAFYVL